MKYTMPMSNQLFTLLPSYESLYLKAISIILFSYLLSLTIKMLFEKVLSRFLKKTRTKTDDIIIKSSKIPIFWSILLIGFYQAISILNPQSSYLIYVRRLITSVILIIWTSAGLKILNTIFYEIEKRLKRSGKSGDVVPFLKNVAIVTIYTGTILILLYVWGINITPLLASAGVFGLAVAFAAKDTVANLFGGISVFFDKPYKISDYVIIDDKYRGEVTQIGMRSTKIKTRDNVLLTVPNSVMVTNAVINETGFDPKLRIRIPLGVSYGEDLEKVEEILIEVLSKHPKVLKKPSPRVRFRNFGDYAIELEVMGVIKTPPERGKTIHELIKRIHKTLNSENVEIPYPRRDIHII